MNHIYPKIFRLDDWDERENLTYQVNNQFIQPGVLTEAGTVALPNSIPATREVIKDDGVYLFDDGEVFYILIGERISNETLYDVIFKFLFKIFGVEAYEDLYDIYEMQEVPDSDYNYRVLNVIEELRRYKNGFYQPEVLIFQK